MTLVVAPSVTPSVPRRFANAAEWLRALGDVPLERIIFDPPPGTATEADLLRYVEGEKRLCELVYGTLVEKPVGINEARIAINLGGELIVYVKRHRLGSVAGEAGTIRLPSTGGVRLPDVAFFSKERLWGSGQKVPTVAPDLAVEVLSESNTRAEMARKLRDYFDSGTRLVWYVEPKDRTVAVYHSGTDPTFVLDASGTLDGEQVVPGFTLPVAELFYGLDADQE